MFDGFDKIGDLAKKKVRHNDFIKIAKLASALRKISIDNLYKIQKNELEMLTTNEIKDNIKVIHSLENRRILLKRNTKKITNQKRKISQFS